MTKSRAVFAAAALFFSLSAFTTVAHVLADLSGTWDVSVQTPDQTINSTLVVKQKGDSLSGSLESELGSAPLVGAVKGDTVSFNFSLDMGGQPLVVRAQGLLSDANSMNGQLDVSGMGVMPFTAKRK